jgi:hypothetical protein
MPARSASQEEERSVAGMHVAFIVRVVSTCCNRVPPAASNPVPCCIWIAAVGHLCKKRAMMLDRPITAPDSDMIGDGTAMGGDQHNH